jgi:hypothetical protein
MGFNARSSEPRWIGSFSMSIMPEELPDNESCAMGISNCSLKAVVTNLCLGTMYSPISEHIFAHQRTVLIEHSVVEDTGSITNSDIIDSIGNARYAETLPLFAQQISTRRAKIMRNISSTIILTIRWIPGKLSILLKTGGRKVRSRQKTVRCATS